MSLINDALNRARAEAASKEAAGRGEIPAAEVPRAPTTRRQPAWVLASVAAAIVIVLFLLARRGPWATEPPSQRTARASTVEPVLARTLGTASDTTPAATSTPQSSEPQSSEPQTREFQTSELQAAEPLAVVPSAETRADTTRAAAAEAETPSQASPEVRPTTIWPADGTDQETWYFVGKLQLAGGGEIELGGIAWSELAPSAMLNGSLLTVGSEILGLRVVAIAPRTVTLAGRGQRFALQLAGTAN